MYLLSFMFVWSDYYYFRIIERGYSLRPLEVEEFQCYRASAPDSIVRTSSDVGPATEIPAIFVLQKDMTVRLNDLDGAFR